MKRKLLLSFTQTMPTRKCFVVLTIAAVVSFDVVKKPFNFKKLNKLCIIDKNRLTSETVI